MRILRRRVIAILALGSTALCAAEAAQQPASRIGNNNALACDTLAAPTKDSERKLAGVEFDQIDIVKALPACERAAQQPVDRPRYQFLYARVLSAAQRYPEAAEQYAAADRARYPRATAGLALLYANGLGVTKDHAKAVLLFRRAGDLGYADAYASLGALYMASDPPDYRQAFVSFDQAAHSGSAWGLVGLGELYGGGLGVAKDQVHALQLFQQAADKGDPLGMHHLGLAYYAGAGVQRNPQAALRWLTASAEAGHPLAQTIVAHMYEDGDGVTSDIERAIYWYRKAAEQRNPVAMTELAARLGKAGSNAEAVSWYRRAAEMEFAEAQTSLGDAYFNASFGLPKDDVQAAYWYRKAAEGGDFFAMIRLGEMYEQGLGGLSHDLSQARQLYTVALQSRHDIDVQQARAHIARLNGAPQRPAATNTDTVSGGFGDLIGQGGFITPTPGSTPPPDRSIRDPRERVIAPPASLAEPAYRPLPTQRATTNDDLKALGLLFALGIAGAWLFSGSSSSSGSGSNGNTDYLDHDYDITRGYDRAGQPCTRLVSPDCF